MNKMIWRRGSKGGKELWKERWSETFVDALELKDVWFEIIVVDEDSHQRNKSVSWIVVWQTFWADPGLRPEAEDVQEIQTKLEADCGLWEKLVQILQRGGSLEER